MDTLPQHGPRAVLPKRRVLIVDNHPFFAGCLRALLEAEPDLVVCGIASGSHQLRERIEASQPDLLVIDLALGSESGLRVGQGLRAGGMTTPILFTSTARTLTVGQLASVSRAAFAGKSRTPARFLATLRRILPPMAVAEDALAADLALVPVAAGA